jgi:2,5-diketo-D-gluconate reductase A
MTTERTTSPVPSLKLNDGHEIPQLGFGVFQVPPDDTAEVVNHALRVGYRSIDTAAAYGNEAGVGEAVAASGLDREQLFITTKLWNDAHSRDQATRAFRHSMDELALEYLDLYLIHWPAPGDGRYVEAWETLCELKDSGRVRSIGTSNFTAEYLERIIDATGVVPAVNQVELHPQFQQRELRDAHRQRGIATEAWSPLGQGQILDDSRIAEIAARHGRTPAQVVLRWHLQLGNVVIPKSVTPSRIEENFEIFDFELSQREMEELEALDEGRRIGPDPERFG